MANEDILWLEASFDHSGLCDGVIFRFLMTDLLTPQVCFFVTSFDM